MYVCTYFQTTHQLDVTLESLPHTTSVLEEEVAMLRISLVSGHAEALDESQEPPYGQDSSTGLLVLGGGAVEARTRLPVTRSTTAEAIPYWFNVKGSFKYEFNGQSSPVVYSQSEIVLSTLSQDSPCNQSVFMLKEPLEVVSGESVTLEVVWRQGVFSASLERHESSQPEGHRTHSCGSEKEERMLM